VRHVVHKILDRKSKGKRLLWRPRHKWVDNIKIDHKETGARMWTGFI
jgi:hypothetical protein